MSIRLEVKCKNSSQILPKMIFVGDNITKQKIGVILMYYLICELPAMLLNPKLKHLNVVYIPTYFYNYKNM